MVAGEVTSEQTPILDCRVVVERGSFDLDAEVVVKPGEIVAVMGPNGAGKTTLLEALIGWLPMSAGWILLDGQTIEAPGEDEITQTHQREICMVFQDGLLFPHLNVRRNIEFGGEVSESNVRALLAALEIEDLKENRPQELSAGQRQRVALARTLAPEPKLVLLDEPLAALDLSGRARARKLIGKVLRDTSAGALFVTHDPADAFALADKILVLEAGRVTQYAAPDQLRTRPATEWVAGLIGWNYFEAMGVGAVVTLPNGTEIATALGDLDGPVAVTINPTAVALYLTQPTGSPRNCWTCHVESIEFLADVARVSLTGPFNLSADITKSAVNELGIKSGSEVWASLKATEVSVQTLADE